MDRSRTPLHMEPLNFGMVSDARDVVLTGVRSVEYSVSTDLKVVENGNMYKVKTSPLSQVFIPHRSFIAVSDLVT